MSNYNETSITGQAWTRCTRIVIENPLNGVPAATFIEERAINADGEVTTRPLGNIVQPFLAEETDGVSANLDETFDLVNPATGEVVGQATIADVYAMLWSAYRHVAAKRDAG